MTEPFSIVYFEWQKYAKSKGFNVVTIVTHDELDLPLASGAVKVMAETLREVSKPMAWPGSDFRYVFEPSAPVEVGCFCYIFDSIVYLFD